jgi:IclR family acetate operon transcriptional repressor
MMMHSADNHSIQVIARAMAVLKACNRLGPGQSLGGIAREVGLPRSTVQRIVQSLAEGGFLIANGKSKSIALGPELLAMGASATANVFEIAHPFLKSLAEKTGETVDLARFSGDRMVFIDQVPGAHRLRAVSAVGDVFPLHCTANGKAALSALGDEAYRFALRGKLSAFTHNTITDHTQLLREIQAIRAGKLAADVEEHALGICAIGASFKDAAGQVYAISIPVPTVRFKQIRNNSENLLVQKIKEIQRALLQGA